MFIISILIFNILFLNSTILGIIFGLIYIASYGDRLGRWFFPEESRVWQKISGIFFLLTSFSLFGAIIYYFYRLNNLAIILILTLIPILISKLEEKWRPATITHSQDANSFSKQSFLSSLFSKLFKNFLLYIFNKKELFKHWRGNIVNLIFSYQTAYFALIFILFRILIKSRTAEAIRSPWLIIPSYFFIFYILASALLILMIAKNRTRKPLIFIAIHFFLGVSLGFVVYKFGYGFDPFVHRATEKVILEQGFIAPKPLYYLGQYSLVVILAKVFKIGVENIDKILVPVLFAIYVPSFLYFSLRKLLRSEQFGYDSVKNSSLFLSVIVFLILPYSGFIATTPQSLANLYALVVIFLSVVSFFNSYSDERENIFFALLLFLSLACAVIHPLTGIPLISFTSLLVLTNKKFRYKKIILFIFAAISLFALPFVFLINSSLSSLSKISINPFSFNKFLSDFSLIKYQRQYHLFRDFIYLYGFNTAFFVILVAIIGIFLAYRKRKFFRNSKKSLLYIVFFGILVFDYFFLKTLMVFESVIPYEQNAYANRIFELSIYFLLPFFLFAAYEFFQKLLFLPIKVVGKRFNEKTYLQFFFFSLLIFWLAASLYLVYPRYDNYASDHGYNISSSDFKAVEFIEDIAKTDYIVLANQNTSAAALSKYGFQKYFCRKNLHGDVIREKCEKIFYYPIPTSSPLYHYYLEMVNKKPSREAMGKAMNLVGAKEGYFVVNDYWWKSDQIITRAKLEADEWHEIDGGKIHVFKYEN